MSGERPSVTESGEPARDTGLRVFICYRREDTKGFARALKAELAVRYGKDRIFMDLDNIAPGQLWEDVIQDAVSKCDAFITLIGKRWLTSRDAQRRLRLEDPLDPVRLEIHTALIRKLRVIPALLDGAMMPDRANLPETLKTYLASKLCRLPMTGTRAFNA